VIVSKTDQLGDSELGRVRDIVRSIAPPSVKIVAARHGALPLDVVLGLGRAAEDHIDARHTHHDEDHEAGREHSHELFDTIVVRPPQLSRESLLRGLTAVVNEHEVYRAKGFASIEGKPMRLVVQGVGRRFDSYFDRPWGERETRKTELVLIGSHLDQGEALRTLVRAAEG
jgi:cobalamin biosynthesis protein CobW